MDAPVEIYLERIRKDRPLIHHITNQVTMNDCANAAYAVGARPTMAFHASEAVFASAQADAVVWNLGTFHPEAAEGIRASLPVVSARPIPVVIDPVGAPAYPGRAAFVLEILSFFEKQHAKNLLQCRIILRCNAGELACIADALQRAAAPSGCPTAAGGVDDLTLPTDPEKICRRFLTIFEGRLPITVAMTGPTDYIGWVGGGAEETDIVPVSRRLLRVPESCRLLTCMTGAGCMSNTLIAAFACVAKTVMDTSGVCDPMGVDAASEVAAAHTALLFLVQSAHKSSKISRGMGSFRINLMDELSRGIMEKDVL